MRSLLALVLPFALALSGCGNQACVLWNEADGACPSQTEASGFLVLSCYGDIVSVDSEGTFETDVCCYDVTKRDTDGYDVPCAQPVLEGSVGSSSGSGF